MYLLVNNYFREMMNKNEMQEKLIDIEARLSHMLRYL